MVNTKITDLTSAAATTAQEIVVNSAGDDRKVAVGSVVDLSRTFADATGLVDSNGNEQLIFQETASAVNYIEITNSTAGGTPLISAAGDDAHIRLKFAVKGNGGGGAFPSYTSPSVEFNVGNFENSVFCIRQASDNNDGPYIVMFKDETTSGVGGGSDVNDFIGAFEMVGRGNSVTNPPVMYGSIWTQATDVTDSAEYGRMIFFVSAGGSQYTRQMQLMDGVVIGGGTSVTLANSPGNGNMSFGINKGIFDQSGNEMVLFAATTTAKANYFTMANSSAATAPIWGVDGSDTTIDLVLAPKGGGSVVTTSPIVTKVTSFAGLPAAGVVGRRAYCNDATTNGFHSTVAGGSTYSVPVYDDGTNWRVG